MPTKNEVTITRYFVDDETRAVYAALQGGAVGLFRKLTPETREAVQNATLQHLMLDRDANMVFVPTRMGAMPLRQASLQKALNLSINESEPDPRFDLTYYQITRNGDIYFSIAGGHAMWADFSLRMKSKLRQHYRTDIRIPNGHAGAKPQDQVFYIRHSHGTDQISKFQLQDMLRWTDYPTATDSPAVKQTTLYTAPSPYAKPTPRPVDKVDSAAVDKQIATITYVATPIVDAEPVETDAEREERLLMELEYLAEMALAQ
jgi:hypothetical protein